MTTMLRWLKMASASGLVGPFAISTMTRAFTCGAFFCQHVAERRRHQDVDREEEQFIVSDMFNIRKVGQRSIIFFVGEGASHVESTGRVHTTLRI